MLSIDTRTLKKGQEVYRVIAWNFHIDQERDTTERKKDGSCGPIDECNRVDRYKIEKVIVHSCGLKRFYLIENDEMKKRAYGHASVFFDNDVSDLAVFEDSQYKYIQNGWIVKSEQDAIKLIEKLYNDDIYHWPTFEII